MVVLFQSAIITFLHTSCESVCDLFSFCHCLRPVVVAQLMDGDINLHSHVTTITFTEDQANVHSIANVVKLALDLEMDIILTDGSGRCILPSPGTSG